jgi:hypothetical protein
LKKISIAAVLQILIFASPILKATVISSQQQKFNQIVAQSYNLEEELEKKAQKQRIVFFKSLLGVYVFLSYFGYAAYLYRTKRYKNSDYLAISTFAPLALPIVLYRDSYFKNRSRNQE